MCRSIVSIACGILVSIPATVGAESVVWSQVQPDLADKGGGGRSTIYLFDPGVSITYNVAVWKVDDAGRKLERVSSGASLPVGSRVLFEFVPHQYTDISWFGVGGAFDDPYGEWIQNAEEPSSGGLCQPHKRYATNVQIEEERERTDLYATLSVAPPASKTITINNETASCTASGNNRFCTLTAAGTVTALFRFGATKGEFYAAEWREDEGCDSSGGAMNLYDDGDEGDDYELSVPQRTIPFSLLVQDAPPASNPPSTPTLSSGGACVAGTPHVITMTASDPDGNSIRYAIDWNNDGGVDEYAPPGTGVYVPSGTQQQASRTFIAGEKTVKVRAEDQGGQASAWASISFTCADEGEGITETEDGPVSQCPVGGLLCNGSEVWRYTAQCSAVFDHACPAGWACSQGACIPPQNQGNITAIPALVGSGQRTNVSWIVNGMVEDSCTVMSNTTADSWTGNAPAATGCTQVNGACLSSPILQQTTFMLSCEREDGGMFTDSTIVDIAPWWSEPGN